MSKENLENFMQQVQLDPSLQQKLAAAPDKEQASRLAVELGAELGLEFNEAEVLDSLNDGELDESELETVSGGWAGPTFNGSELEAVAGGRSWPKDPSQQRRKQE